MSDHPEQDAEYRNHLRLLASEIIHKLYEAKDADQLTLLKIASDRALELLTEQERPVAYDDGTVGTE